MRGYSIFALGLVIGTIAGIVSTLVALGVSKFIKAGAGDDELAELPHPYNVKYWCVVCGHVDFRREAKDGVCCPKCEGGLLWKVMRNG